MLDAYWGFRSEPFRDPVRNGFFYSMPGDEALARMQFLVNGNHRLGILLSESGAGKTVTLQKFSQVIGNAFTDANYFSALGVDSQEFIFQIANQFRVMDRSSLPAMWQGIFDHVAVNSLQNISTVLLFDDLDECDADVLTIVARLAQGVPANQRLTIVASAHSQRATLLGKRLLELASLRVELWPWSAEETSAFITAEMQRCGCDRAVFDVRALQQIHTRSNGIPRAICRLAELSMTAAAGGQMNLVDPETVDSVADELQLSAA